MHEALAETGTEYKIQTDRQNNHVTLSKKIIPSQVSISSHVEMWKTAYLSRLERRLNRIDVNLASLRASSRPPYFGG